jgi:Heavy metal associated domain 2
VTTGNGIAAVPTDGIRIVHATPGRIRLRVAQARENQALAHQLQQRLVSLPGVHSVSVNSLTGSVLIFYQVNGVDPHEFQRAFAEPLGVLFPGLPPVDLTSWSPPVANGLVSQVSPLSEQVRAFFSGLNTNVDQLTSGSADLKTLVPLALFLLGIRGLLTSDRLSVPAWYDFFWFALGTYFMFYPRPGEGKEVTGPL